MAILSSNNPIDLNNTDPAFDLGGGTTYFNAPASLSCDVLGDCTIQYNGTPTEISFTGYIASGITITIDEASVTGIATTLSEAEFNATFANSGSYTRLTQKGTIRVTGLPENARVVLKDPTTFARIDAATGTDTALADSSGNATTTYEHEVGAVVLIDVFATGYINVSRRSVTVVFGVNDVAVDLSQSYGYDLNPSITVKDIISESGSTTTVDASGYISINLQTKEIIFEQAADMKQALSALSAQWSSQVSLYGAVDNYLPFNIDDVRGVSIDEPYSISNANNVDNYGFAEFDSEGEFSRVQYSIQTEGNIDAVVKQRWVYAGVNQAWVTATTGPDDVAILLDHTVQTINNHMMMKKPSYLYVFRDESVRISGGRFQTNYTNNNKAFSLVLDENVTVALPDGDVGTGNEQCRYVEGSNVTYTDANSVTHTFTKVIYIKASSIDTQDVVNQIDVALANNDDFTGEGISRPTGKPYTFVNGVITLDQGYFIKYNSGADIGGTFTALIVQSSNLGQVAYPETRTVLINNNGTVSARFGLLDSTSVLDASGWVGDWLQDLSGNDLKNIRVDAGSTVTFSIISSVDVPTRIVWLDSEVEAGFTTATMKATPDLITITPQAETIILYRDETQTVSNSTVGTLAWQPEIDNITFNWATKRVIVPNSIQDFEINYGYRAWRKVVEADFDYMKYGIPFRGINQEQPSGTTSNAHLFNPSWRVKNDWLIDCQADRSTAIAFQLKAAGLDREDSDSPNFTSEVVYATPFANGGSVTLNIVQGTSTEFQANTTATLESLQSLANLINQYTNEVYNFNRFLRRPEAKLFGLKPGIATTFVDDSEY